MYNLLNPPKTNDLITMLDPTNQERLLSSSCCSELTIINSIPNINISTTFSFVSSSSSSSYGSRRNHPVCHRVLLVLFRTCCPHDPQLESTCSSVCWWGLRDPWPLLPPAERPRRHRPRQTQLRWPSLLHRRCLPRHLLRLLPQYHWGIKLTAIKPLHHCKLIEFDWILTSFRRLERRWLLRFAFAWPLTGTTASSGSPRRLLAARSRCTISAWSYHRLR